MHVTAQKQEIKTRRYWKQKKAVSKSSLKSFCLRDSKGTPIPDFSGIIYLISISYIAKGTLEEV